MHGLLLRTCVCVFVYILLCNHACEFMNVCPHEGVYAYVHLYVCMCRISLCACDCVFGVCV